MSFALFETRSQVTTAEDEVVPSQAEIERQIAKLEEDSAKDVQRQLEQQRSATSECKVEQHVKEVAKDVEEDLAPVWEAAKQEVETVIKDAEAEMRELESAEKGE